MIRSEKQILRTAARASLKAFSGKSEASGRIRRALRGWSVWRQARTIYGFSPLPAEPDWREKLPEDKIFAFPKIAGDHLEFFVAATFHPGALGIHEPHAGDPAPPPDLVLVPGLAFDRLGGRLGRGGGFYDRWLETAPAGAFILGLCFACQLVDAIPREPHDARMHAVLTEQGLIFPSADDTANRPAAAKSPPPPR